MYFLIAGILAFLVAIIHSALGEHLVFRRMRNSTIIPTNGGTLLKERHVRILWASWHIVSIFGVALGVVLLQLSTESTLEQLRSLVINAIAISMLLSSLLVFISTKALHPGWIGLLLISVATWLGG